MKLGVFTVLFADKNLEEMLDYVKNAGLDAVEIGTGGYPGDAHLKLDVLLNSEAERQTFLEKVNSRGLTISALSCHGNPVSPDEAFRKDSHETLVKTIKLAGLLNIPVVNTFSGTPGDSEDGKYPNWPVTPWPEEYSTVLKWQWEEKLVPYWPHTMLKLREQTGNAIGANLDPSHLWWQGIDPVAAIKILGKANAIHHFHAKDTYIDQEHVNMYGLTDMQPYSEVQSRAWTFRSVGYGHSVKVWSDIISALRTYGYDHVISIEHEDPIMSIDEGFMRAVENLKSVLIYDQPADMWWA